MTLLNLTSDEDVNIVPVDYDPLAMRVNQGTRIKFMFTTARKT